MRETGSLQTGRLLLTFRQSIPMIRRSYLRKLSLGIGKCKRKTSDTSWGMFILVGRLLARDPGALKCEFFISTTTCANTARISAPSLSPARWRGAATRRRFSPLRPDELSDLEISVDVLGEPEPVSSIEELDPRNYGVIVEREHRRGLLLPDLPGVDTPEQQVDIALRKAWIGTDERYKMYRFRVVRYH